MTDVDLLSHHTSLIRYGDSILSKFGGTAETDTASFAAMAGFASVIGMAQIKLHKEKGGRILNSLLVPFLNAAAAPAAGEYADWLRWTNVKDRHRCPAASVSRATTPSASAPHNVLAHGDAESHALAALLKALLKENCLDKRTPRGNSASIPVKRSVAIPLNEMGNNVLQQWKLRSVRAATQA
ncbi:hypothetical protein [Rhodococcus qingshengii]|uniref:hypothetical protein n=1 Tax=Rhodococcus qingshengii TaxID=334542 RepID=UPI001EE70E4A|nr:hypothetical protein [Rhodococcus qingshengii]